ncbi:MAG: hypothetical protein IIB46_06060 [Nitrospinae bacterium]|nr:hypothetical protein [Nitrospinota bacterium]
MKLSKGKNIMNYLQAKELAKTDINAAWDLAKTDESMNEGVTKAQWVKHISAALKRDEEELASRPALDLRMVEGGF